MKSIKEIILLFLVLFSFLGLVSNSVVFRSYIYQQKTVKDMNYAQPRLSLDEAKKLDLSYPNINIYVVPFKTHLGRVYLRDSMYKDAIASFHRARKINPFLLINENYLAETYLSINELDSFKFYARKIFNKAPNHPGHFAFYIKSLDSLQNSKKIDSAFNTISVKSTKIWKIYLASIYNTGTIKEQAERNIKIADSIYKKNKEIQYIIDAIRYGGDNIEKSDELIGVADAIAKVGDFEGSIKVLKKALELYPSSNSIYDKIATSYFKISMNDSSLKYINKIDLSKYENPGRYFLIKGINLVKLDKKEEGCQALYQSIILGDKEAVKANRSFCN